MGTLWTPSGEHVPDPGDTGEPQPIEAHGHTDVPSAEELTAIREVHRQIREAPVEDVIANHATGFIQLALIHLGIATPPDETGALPVPDLAKAGVAIDALSAIVDGLGSRLGAHESPLREALSQVQQAYVAVSDALDERTGTSDDD